VDDLPWLASLLWVSLSVLTLVVWWQEGHPACNNLSKGSFWRRRPCFV